MVHSVPEEDLRPLVMDLRERGEYIFVTDNCEEFYCKFGRFWTEFVKAMVED
jgi:hypothetical protein